MVNMPPKYHPETEAIHGGFKPELSEGSAKAPVFKTTTYVARRAEDLERAFRFAYGFIEDNPDLPPVLMYSRVNNPDGEICENRLNSQIKNSQSCALFSSGMAAITTLLITFLRPGSTILHTGPVYGGTDHQIKHIWNEFDIESVEFGPDDTYAKVDMELSDRGINNVAIVFVESPANPTNTIFDLELYSLIAKKYNAIYVVDDTFLGPLGQNPLTFGADLALYSATKFIGGHSDVTAGAVAGRKSLVDQLKLMRGVLGTILSPSDAERLMRSLETLDIRINKHTVNALRVSDFLQSHCRVEKVYHLGCLDEKSRQGKIYKKLGLKPGIMMSFDIKGGKNEAYKFLNSLKVVKLAVSLGGTISLAEHPASMTHIAVSDEDKKRYGITDKMIRLSVGLEHLDDIIEDLRQALGSAV